MTGGKTAMVLCFVFKIFGNVYMTHMFVCVDSACGCGDIGCGSTAESIWS